MYWIFKNDVKSNLPHTPTIQEIEDFFDEILTKTYEQEQSMKEKDIDTIKDTPDEAIVQEKKNSTCSQSSSDSGKYGRTSMARTSWGPFRTMF